jgi:1-acyl-sn-glycerol-3-phosphate acyltransferase
MASEDGRRSVVEERVLEVVSQLVTELEGGTPRRPALDDSFDRDLGISSLERVELLLRIERALGVRLPETVMAEAASPSALVAAILTARPSPSEPAQPVIQPATPGKSAPPATRTLVEALQWHAERFPDHTHLYLRNDDGSERLITHGELWSRATAIAGGLRSVGLSRGARVGLILRTEQAFFEAFFGALAAGAVPVPLYPPVRADDIPAYARRQQAILRNADAQILVTFAEAERVGTLIRSQVPSLEGVTTVDSLARSGVGAASPPRPASDDPALIQYTSGSTGNPKGVLLSHANILANIRAIGAALKVGPEEVSVSWLPLYHDMGLIGMWLGSLYFGAPLALMSPLAFLARPARWLWAIHAHRGTLSAAPNFAFDLCAAKIRDDEITGLDLGSWRLALNGAEPVSAETIERFTRRFEPYGFRRAAMSPAYGLAESSVAVTLSAPGIVPRVDRVVRDRFERAREVTPASEGDPRPLRFVSCGRALGDHEVRIVDREGHRLADRHEGRILFRGPSVTRGYFRNPAATAATLLPDGWMVSGDRGYWVDGLLFVTGREKDLIIQGGRNIWAEEVERVASGVSGIRQGCVAAFGVPDAGSGTERFVIVAETRERGPQKHEALRRAIRDRVVEAIGATPDVVVIAEPRTVLKTPNGKIQRSAMRAAYLEGRLGQRRPAVRQWAALIAADQWARAGRLARQAGRAVFTAYVAMVLLATLPVLWACLLLIPPGRLADRAAKRWSALALSLCGLRPRVTGRSNLTGLTNGILLANHASYIDVVVLMAALPVEFHFLAKRALADYPLVGTVIRKARHVTIEKANLSDRLAGANDLARRLRDGELLLVFPEGTFVRAPGLLPFRLGAFRAAVDAGRPVVPVAVRGTRHVLPDETWLFRHGPIAVTIGTPLTPQAEGWPEMVRLRDLVLAEIARESGEDQAAPPSGAAPASLQP